jgi:type IX secretion system substrate protein/photosynthesis system II assembly factor YCF48-like protein
MNKIILIVVALSAFAFKSYSQWVRQTAPSGTSNLYSVFAIDSNAVACSSDTRIVRTVNGGTLWASNVNILGAIFSVIHTAEPTHWYAKSSNSNWFAVEGNPVGISASSSGPSDVLGLHFRTASCAVAVGLGGTVYTTCDTGLIWTTITPITNFNLNCVWFADSVIGVACGNSGSLIRTTDEGNTWSNIITAGIFNLYGVTFPTTTTGYICGAMGTFLKSTDTGHTWTSMPLGITNDLRGVYFTDSVTGYVVGTLGLIDKTTDGGITWTTMTSGTTSQLNSVHFPNPNVGWAVGNDSVILKYTATITGTPSIPACCSPVSIYPNPTTGEVYLDFHQSGNSSVSVFNTLGEKVYDASILSNNNTPYKIDLNNFAGGVYFIRIQTGDNQIQTEKLVLMK